jgi:hypothetical protein
MAGGIFSGYPFSLNIKCIIFTILIAGGYWYLPRRNMWVLFLLLWLPYIALAWYDYFYECSADGRMQPTLLPFGRYLFLPFKPPDYKKRYADLPPSAIGDMNRLDHIVLWSIIIFGGAGGLWWYAGRIKN